MTCLQLTLAVDHQAGSRQAEAALELPGAELDPFGAAGNVAASEQLVEAPEVLLGGHQHHLLAALAGHRHLVRETLELVLQLVAEARPKVDPVSRGEEIAEPQLGAGQQGLDFYQGVLELLGGQRQTLLDRANVVLVCASSRRGGRSPLRGSGNRASPPGAF